MLVASTAISETEMTVFSPSVHSLGFEPEIGQTLWNRARSEDLLYVTPPTLSLNRSNLFLVHFSIAVVVHAVAELNSLWMDKVIIIVAVAILRGVGRKFFTTLDGFRSETIPVIILVIFSGHPLLDGSVNPSGHGHAWIEIDSFVRNPSSSLSWRQENSFPPLSQTGGVASAS